MTLGTVLDTIETDSVGKFPAMICPGHAAASAAQTAIRLIILLIVSFMVLFTSLLVALKFAAELRESTPCTQFWP